MEGVGGVGGLTFGADVLRSLVGFSCGRLVTPHCFCPFFPLCLFFVNNIHPPIPETSTHISLYSHSSFSNPPSNLLQSFFSSLSLWLPHFSYTLHASVGGWKSSVVPPFDVLYIFPLPYTLLLRAGICVSSLTSFFASCNSI